MQVFGNIATPVEMRVSKQGKQYAQFRLAESTKGVDTEPTFYTVRVMKNQVFDFVKGDFLKVTGRLTVDYYLSRDGKPTGTLLIIAFEASKIAKPSQTAAQNKVNEVVEKPAVVAPTQVAPVPPAPTQPARPQFAGWSGYAQV